MLLLSFCLMTAIYARIRQLYLYTSFHLSQVLHQLDVGNNNGVPLLENTLEDTKRILRPKSVLLITTQLPTYIRDAIWYMQLQRGVTEKLANTLIPAKQYVALFEKHGYRCVAALNLLSATKTIFVDYHDPEGPLKEDWRVGTNEFGLADAQEVHEMEAKLRDLKENGNLRKFMEENDKTLEMGISTLFACVAHSF